MIWLPHTVTVPPASEPITLAEAKAQCGIDESDDFFDTLLTGLIAAARSHVEAYTGSKLVEQTVQMKGDRFCNDMYLPVGPVQSITSVQYLDTDGATQTLSTDVYELIGADTLDASIGRKVNQSWPSVLTHRAAVTVTAVCGYEELPEAIKHALLLAVGSWFADREAGDFPSGAESLLANYRKF